MYQIIDKRANGKTSRLLLLAKENNGIVVCRAPHLMKEKAYNYGIVGIDFMSYDEYVLFQRMNTDNSKPIYIDELSLFLKYVDPNLAGYSESVE